MIEDKSAIVRKIRGLLAKANNTENEHEAAAFAAKARDLLAQHSIETIEEISEDPIVSKSLKHPYLSVPWKNLHNRVGQLYFCMMKTGFVFNENKGKLEKRMSFVGRENNVAVAESMAEYLVNTVIRLSREYSKDKVKQIQFQRGCIIGLEQRIIKMLSAQETETASSPATGTTLPDLYRRELDLVEAHMVASGVKFTNGKTSTASGSDAVAGWDASKNVNLGCQINPTVAATMIEYKN